MNIHYLLQQSAMRLYTSARVYDKDGCLLELCRMDPELDDGNVVAALTENGILVAPDINPILFSVNEQIYYGLVQAPERDYLLGPTHFLLDTPAGRIAPPRMKTDIPLPEIDLEPLLRLIPDCSLQILAEDTVTLYNLEHDDLREYMDPATLIETSIHPPGKSEDTMETMVMTMFDQVENSFVHNPYNHEKLEVSYVRNGDVESLRTLLKERFPGRYGRLSDNPIQQEIYLGIVAITLASRAAIDAGLHPETAFYLSDVSIHRIGTSRDVNEIIRLTVEAELHYAELVREMKLTADDEASEENLHISRCKDYIFAHMHGKITVQEIASAIGLETNYLSTLFKKCEKKTLKNYITEEKVKLIKNLLTFSTYSYIEIANYLGFASQSHMGMEFKKITGMTPGEYRSRYVREDFIKDSIDE